MMRKFLLCLGFALLPLIARAQTAEDLAKELEQLYSHGAVTTISFSIDGAKNTLSFAHGTSQFRLDNTTDLITSDGATIWHYSKQRKEVVIDKVNAKGGSFANASELVKFSSNYSALLSKKKEKYELSLTPSQNLSKLLENIGRISRIVFTLTKSPAKGIVIQKITAQSSQGEVSAGNIKIQSLKKINSSLFSFSAPKGVKVVDLRD
ncbi:MAG: hypothetical protein WCH46_08865 [bacterium]